MAYLHLHHQLHFFIHRCKYFCILSKLLKFVKENISRHVIAKRLRTKKITCKKLFPFMSNLYTELYRKKNPYQSFDLS